MVESDTFTIQVTDHGESIPKEQLPYIFERFYKSSSGNNKNGSGLGLAIAGEIAKRHGARIQVQSDDRATIFTVIFFV